MKPSATRLVLALAGIAALLSADKAHGTLVTWSVDPAQSFVRLAIPDQTVTVDTTTATIRIRDANNNAWSDAGGRRAFLDGTISSDYSDGTSIKFNGGSNNLFALQAGSFRPNPAQFDPNAIDADNPDGKYSGTGGAPAAMAAKVRGSVSFLTVDLAYIAFRNMFFDLASGTMPLAGGTTFAGGANNFGIQSALLDVDGLSAAIVGQVIPDILGSPLANVTGVNTLGGSINHTPLGLIVLTVNINVPIAIDLDGTIVNAIATGQIVAYPIPEPSSILLAGFATFGLCWAGRRRLRRAER